MLFFWYEMLLFLHWGESDFSKYSPVNSWQPLKNHKLSAAVFSSIVPSTEQKPTATKKKIHRSSYALERTNFQYLLWRLSLPDQRTPQLFHTSTCCSYNLGITVNSTHSLSQLFGLQWICVSLSLTVE